MARSYTRVYSEAIHSSVAGCRMLGELQVNHTVHAKRCIALCYIALQWTRASSLLVVVVAGARHAQNVRRPPPNVSGSFVRKIAPPPARIFPRKVELQYP